MADTTGLNKSQLKVYHIIILSFNFFKEGWFEDSTTNKVSNNPKGLMMKPTGE